MILVSFLAVRLFSLLQPGTFETFSLLLLTLRSALDEILYCKLVFVSILELNFAVDLNRINAAVDRGVVLELTHAR